MKRVTLSSGFVKSLVSLISFTLVMGMFAFVPLEAQAGRYAAIVMDAKTGQILHAHAADERRFPASLTKMMTLYLTFDALKSGHLKLNQKLNVSAFAASQAPSKLGLKAGDQITVEQAILALTTKSANDAAVVLAENIAGSETAFAARMNRKARQLGMTHTVFRNASGLPNLHQVTTVRDMALLSRMLIKNQSKYYHYFSQRTFDFNGEVLENHNRLLTRYPGMDGLKTGYISASGYNLAASAVHQGKRLICVVFGGPSAGWRDNRVANLLDYGFAHLPRMTTLAQLSDKPPVPKAKPDSDLEKADITDAEVAQVDNSAEDSSPVDSKNIEQGDADVSDESSPHFTLITSAQAAESLISQPAAHDTVKAWGVQVGAYNTLQAGQDGLTRAAQIVPDMLDLTAGQVISSSADAGTVYRARFTGLDKGSAQAVCSALQRTGRDCFVLNSAALSSKATSSTDEEN